LGVYTVSLISKEVSLNRSQMEVKQL
jgi:hypothetical protein